MIANSHIPEPLRAILNGFANLPPFEQYRRTTALLDAVTELAAEVTPCEHRRISTPDGDYCLNCDIAMPPVPMYLVPDLAATTTTCEMIYPRKPKPSAEHIAECDDCELYFGEIDYGPTLTERMGLELNEE